MSNSATTIFDRIASQWKDDPHKSAYIAEARDQTSINFYCQNYELAVALRAAHNMAIDKSATEGGQTGGGEVASKKEGELSISYHKGSSTGSVTDEYFNKSIYGIRLKALRTGSGVTVSVAGITSQDIF
jgi:hypothetical protein